MKTNTSLSRKDFLSTGLVTAASFLLVPQVVPAAQPEKPPALAAEMVREFVKVAHSDVGKVQKMLEEQPLLLNAAWDWGGGDFETAIGAAGHTGQKETAHYLLEKGARTDLFVLTMLGKTDIVTATLTAYPALLHSAGPHGFTLLHHAEKGGKDAEELFTYLQKLGLTEKQKKLF